MNKKTLYILTVTLIAAQIATFLRISDLQAQIQSARNEINHLRQSNANEINAIYGNIDEMLKREASIIESASTEIGAPDSGALTVPIKFSVTPKVVGESTAVSIDIDGELFPMDRKGSTFTTTVSQDIFGSVAPKFVSGDNGIEKITSDERLAIGSIKASVFPVPHPQLYGETRYSNGTYTYKGTLNTDFKRNVSGITFTEMRFVIKIDDIALSDEIIPIDVPDGWSVDKKIPLKDGQVCTMTVIATDSIGLEHHCEVSHWVAGANAQREPFFYDERIYSEDGKLLWWPEYEQTPTGF